MLLMPFPRVMLLSVGCAVLVLSGLGTVSAMSELNFSHHNYTAMEAVLKGIAADYSNIAKLYSIGKSVQGRELWVLLLSAYPEERPVGMPQAKYIANMHGNEVVGRELLLHLAMELVQNYTRGDERVETLLNSTRVHFLPSMNPDGYELAGAVDCNGVEGRRNANHFDLNRNFPEHFYPDYSPERQPETTAVMEWMKTEPFTLSANLHGGAVVANYPLDTNPEDTAVYTRSPDDDMYRELSTTYSNNHANMYLGNVCPGDYFEGGITNGAEWYPIKGGMQDYGYTKHSIMELTLEVSCCKYPAESELETFYTNNRESLISLLEKIHSGIKGVITDEEGLPIEGAVVKIDDRWPTTTTEKGEYWKLLPSNTQVKITVELNGQEISMNATSGNNATGSETVMWPPAGLYISHSLSMYYYSAQAQVVVCTFIAWLASRNTLSLSW